MNDAIAITRGARETQWVREVNVEDASLVESRLVESRSGHGIALLSTDGRPLHITQKGWHLFKHISDAQDLHTPGSMPAVIKQICLDIHTRLHAKAGVKDWEQLQVQRVAGSPACPILLRGFGLPDANHQAQARVLIILELVRQRQQLGEQAKERFQLTPREHTVVQNLAKGWTNKEIGSALGITEPTVKAHIKHIMEKTKCTTRTGILARILDA